MSMTCKACRVPDRAILSLMLAQGDSFRTIGKRFGISASAIRSHKKHAGQTPLGAEIVHVIEAQRVEEAETFADELKRLKAETLRYAKLSEGVGDFRGAGTQIKNLSDIAFRLAEMVAGSADTAAKIPVSFTFPDSAALAAARALGYHTDATVRTTAGPNSEDERDHE